MHRFLLSILLLSLVASAQPAERAYDENAESWNFSTDEGAGGSSYLGVDIADVSAERLSALKLKEEHGAEVTMVDKDAPAGKADVREHDVILSLNGSPVESAAQLRRMIKETPPGRVVTLGISRDGQPLTVKVQLADRHKSMDWEPSNHEFHFEMPNILIPDVDVPTPMVIAHTSLRTGLVTENITQQLGEFFGLKGKNGALVRSVDKASAGEKAGFRAGDVIIKVNNQEVRDAPDFAHALRTSTSNPATVTIVRDKKEQNLTLALPEKKKSGLLMEETVDLPELSTETQLAIQRAQAELAQLGPDILEKVEQRIAQAGKQAQRYGEQSQQLQKEMEKHLEDLQKKMQDREQKLKHESSGDWIEI